MNVLPWFFTLFGAVVSTDSSEQNLPCMSKDVHQFLDEILEKARVELDDPLRLPPRSSFVELDDGLLWGLSNISRMGVAEVSCEGEQGVRIKGVITTDELKGRYTWRSRSGRDREGYVVFISNDFQAEVEGLIEDGRPTLERFEIKKFKDARIELTGLGLLTWAVGETTTLMSGIFQRSIASAIQGPIKEALEKQMREIEM